MDDPARVHAADLVDFRNCHGLAIGDDGQGLERRLRQANGRLETLDEFPQHFVVLGLGREFVAAGDGPDLDAVRRALVVRNQFGEFRLDALARLTFQCAEHLLHRHRLWGDVDDAFEDGFQRVVVEHEISFQLSVLSYQCGPSFRPLTTDD